MKKEFVTLETAKLLKEKGFNEDCKTFFIDKKGSITKRLSLKNEDLPESCYSRPSQSIVQKWLRETKNLHVEISYMYGNYWIYDILTIPKHDLIGLADRPLIHYESYEGALEEGIKEALKLI